MSALLMGRAFYADLPPRLKLTLLALADHANDDGTGVMVGQERLAAKVGVERHSIGRYLARLRELGYIERTRQARGPGRGRRDAGAPDHYRLVVEALPQNMERSVPSFPPEPENMEHIVFHKPSDISTNLSCRDNGDTELAFARSRARKRDPVFEALFQLETGLAYSPEVGKTALTRKARASLNAAAAEIRETGISPEELRAAIAAWPRVMGSATCTAQAVAKHLPRLRAAARGVVFRHEDSAEAIAARVEARLAAGGDDA